MFTERLYYTDSYLTHFSAQVVEHAESNGHPVVALDQSAFYPESGGQPADHGTLNDIAVTDVQVNHGVVWHTLAQPLTADHVQGVIDWPRRLDHMQQHHGQHLLSAAFEQLYGLRTLSFHLGTAAATIDLAGSTLTTEQANTVEELTNQVIWEDRPILARFVTPEELDKLPLRKPPTVTENVRVVSVPGFDHSACGGTHPRATGGVGILHIRRWERRGDIVRIEFLCGGRALRDLRWKNATLNRLATTLSVGAEEVESATLRIREAEERTRKRWETTTTQLLNYQAQELLAQAEQIGELRVVCQAFTDRSLEDMRTLARAITASGGVALLGLQAEKTQLIFARAEALNAPDCGKLLRSTLGPFGGRGGGQATLAQGGLPDATQLETALDAAVAQLRRETLV